MRKETNTTASLTEKKKKKKKHFPTPLSYRIPHRCAILYMCEFPLTVMINSSVSFVFWLIICDLFALERLVTLKGNTPSIQPLKPHCRGSGLMFVEYTTPRHRPALNLRIAHHIYPGAFMSSDGCCWHTDLIPGCLSPPDRALTASYQRPTRTRRGPVDH